MNNSTALITGASEGIGYELSFLFAKSKINLVLVARNSLKLNNLSEELKKKFGVLVEVLSIDLSLVESPDLVFNFCVHKNIKINYLINNAGVGDYGIFATTDWVRQSQMINLNISALIHLTHLFLPQMISDGFGKIMNVSSTAAFLPGPRMSVYFATKAFVQSFSEALFAELDGTGVFVTVLCPGSTNSKFAFSANIIDSDSFYDPKLPSSKEVALLGFKAVMANKFVVIHGFRNRLFINYLRLFSRERILKISRKKMGV